VKSPKPPSLEELNAERVRVPAATAFVHVTQHFSITLAVPNLNLRVPRNQTKPMKSPLFKILVTALFIAACANVQARFVTLTVNNNVAAGTISLLAEITIQSNEVATVRFCSPAVNLTTIKDGITVSSFQNFQSFPAIVIAGPAVLQVRPSTSVDRGFCTIEITPESFPPDKTLVIPEGTGANVTFECSTNLLDWAPVWQGTYTNAPSSKFFRIRADRLP
jgi:hypothetical protein